MCLTHNRRHVLIDLGPSYFQYIDSTADKPTVLAKLLGFYTIEVKNLESGNTQAKADLLVTENLFAHQKVTKTFDLKGIQGRKVKTGQESGQKKTMFDGEWIEGELCRSGSWVVHLRWSQVNNARQFFFAHIPSWSLRKLSKVIRNSWPKTILWTIRKSIIAERE